jgi:hypothetical protein
MSDTSPPQTTVVLLAHFTILALVAWGKNHKVVIRLLKPLEEAL